jgi:HD-GYP domain-containing protein (c-di-GMP phosphodiesterase class II)
MSNGEKKTFRVSELKDARLPPGQNRSGVPERSAVDFRRLAPQIQSEVSPDQPLPELGDALPAVSEATLKVLYGEAADYVRDMFQAVKSDRRFDLAAGFGIIRKFVSLPEGTFFARITRADDPYQFVVNHSVNVAIYAIQMARYFGWNHDRQLEIGMAGLVHDIGIATIPEATIYKRATFAPSEFKIFRERPMAA